ncbi:MAG: 4-vinyl reductase [Candidatus Lernaella stagnicola]|nr:4-vinyl reductase [Candidatus Lernaella stagnicola]
MKQTRRGRDNVSDVVRGRFIEYVNKNSDNRHLGPDRNDKLEQQQRRQMIWMNRGMGFLERHPLLVRILLRPLANAPWLSRKLPVLFRAFMGATAFEIHDVDKTGGRIGIGGVQEIMAGSKIIHLLHTTLAASMGPEKKAQTLYEMGKALCRWEVSQALEQGRWAPAPLVPLMVHGQILEQIQQDPVTAEFFGNVIRTMSKLITDEGGWGHLTFDFSAFPLKVMLDNSQEAAWLGPSSEPTCSFYSGIVAGYASTISGQELEAKEVACKAMGDPQCVFELVRKNEEPVH